MLTGSLGMLPSASLGAPDATGRRQALYEPIHGSAPDIAGKDIANPLARSLSFAMLLRYSFDLADDADLIENGGRRACSTKGIRTADIMQPGMTRVVDHADGRRAAAASSTSSPPDGGSIEGDELGRRWRGRSRGSPRRAGACRRG